MSKKLVAALGLVMVIGIVLTACKPTATPAPEPTEQTMVIGFTTSQTGKYNVSSTRQVNGLRLWMDQVNEAGGIELSDGTVINFDAVTYDDESNKDRVQELYTRLATEDNADFLISPYSSGLTAAAAVIGMAWTAHAKELSIERIAGAQPRNVVFILSDDHRYDAMGFMGHPFLETPHMDSMAANGVHLKNAFVTTSLCSPSRASILTGLYTCKHRVIDNNRLVPPGTVFFPQYLQKAGYETAFGGKTHWMRGMTPESTGFTMLTRDQRDGLAQACVEFLRAKHDKPFLLVASFINPHDICYMAIDDYTRAEGQPVMYPKSRVERERLATALELPAGVTRDDFFARLCPPLPANHEVPALEPECITERYLRARSFRQYARTKWSDERWRQHRWAYCRLTEMVDAHIAKVLDARPDIASAQELVQEAFRARAGK